MRSLFICLLSLLFLQGTAQTIDTKSTDKYVKQVNTFLKENVYTKKPLADKSPTGGTVTGYYLKNRLQLITAVKSDDFGFIEHSFYIEKDSLVFIKECTVVLKQPMSGKEFEDYETYVLFNTQNGTTDFSKWPLLTDIANTYYFQNSRIIKYQLKSFNKNVKPADSEIDESNKELVAHFLTHLEELKSTN